MQISYDTETKILNLDGIEYIKLFDNNDYPCNKCSLQNICEYGDKNIIIIKIIREICNEENTYFIKRANKMFLTKKDIAEKFNINSEDFIITDYKM